ncbi:unnamed protein product, partial [Didymodactylos carnosus]
MEKTSKHKYVKDRTTGQKYRMDGYLLADDLPKQEELKRDFSTIIKYKIDQVPAKVDLRKYMTRVEQQYSLSSCVGNAVVSAMEYLVKRRTSKEVNYSRLFLYYNARTGLPVMKDQGCKIPDCLEHLYEIGCCYEKIWPYVTNKVNVKPYKTAYKQAKMHKIGSAMKLKTDLNEIKICLAQGFPVVFGLRTLPSFHKAFGTGILKVPTDEEIAAAKNKNEISGHAMLIVGYSDKSKSFIVRNSYGRKWGDRGYCYIEYDYILTADQMWIIRENSQDNGFEPADTWDNKDEIDLRERAISRNKFPHDVAIVEREEPEPPVGDQYYDPPELEYTNNSKQRVSNGSDGHFGRYSDYRHFGGRGDYRNFGNHKDSDSEDYEDSGGKDYENFGGEGGFAQFGGGNEFGQFDDDDEFGQFDGDDEFGQFGDDNEFAQFDGDDEFGQFDGDDEFGQFDDDNEFGQFGFDNEFGFAGGDEFRQFGGDNDFGFAGGDGGFDHFGGDNGFGYAGGDGGFGQFGGDNGSGYADG